MKIAESCGDAGKDNKIMIQGGFLSICESLYSRNHTFIGVPCRWQKIILGSFLIAKLFTENNRFNDLGILLLINLIHQYMFSGFRPPSCKWGKLSPFNY